jgi:hypothetical protein
MAKKKKRLTGRELIERQYPGAHERHEQVQRRLRELIEAIDRRIEESRRASGAA